MSDIDTAVVDGLKALDSKWPIREADMGWVGQICRNPRRTSIPAPRPKVREENRINLKHQRVEILVAVPTEVQLFRVVKPWDTPDRAPFPVEC